MLEFNKRGFMENMENNYPEPMRDPFTRDILSNLVDLICEKYSVDEPAFFFALDQNIPDLTVSDVGPFIRENKEEE